MPAIDSDFRVKSLKEALADRPQALHVASYFRFMPGNENASYLLLGNGDGLNIGRLRADPDLKFTGIDLLALSACETARGEGAEGEEIESFCALTQVNGASAISATLWQIADDSTAKLMAGSHDGLIGGRLDKALALQRLQNAMIRGSAVKIAVLGSRSAMPVDVGDDVNWEGAGASTKHPYFRSAFILMGNWR